MRQLCTPRASARASAVIDRLIGAGIPWKSVELAVSLVRTGRVDLVQAVIDGKLELSHALAVARRALVTRPNGGMHD